VATIAGGIWRRNGTSYVSGAQADDGVVQDASLWSPRPTLAHLPDERLFASTIGGKRQHVYAAGTMRSSTFRAWVSAISFGRTGEASLKSLETLTSSAGYDDSVAEGVSVDSRGHPVVVGEVFSSSGSGEAAVLWKGSSPPVLFQSLVGSTPWIIRRSIGSQRRGRHCGRRHIGRGSSCSSPKTDSPRDGFPLGER
jgi:hypothetical protein